MSVQQCGAAPASNTLFIPGAVAVSFSITSVIALGGMQRFTLGQYTWRCAQERNQSLLPSFASLSFALCVNIYIYIFLILGFLCKALTSMDHRKQAKRVPTW